MNTSLRRISVMIMALIVLLLANATLTQVFTADGLRSSQRDLNRAFSCCDHGRPSALEPRLEPGGVALVALEEDVPARDEGRDVDEPEPLDACLEVGHLDQRLPADVDPSQ